MFCEIFIKGNGSAMQNRYDVAELLLVARNKILAGEQKSILHDLNGNDVGCFEVGDEV
jgi:hypothetical protein